MTNKLYFILAILIGGFWLNSDAETQSCKEFPAYHLLDFWLGSWDVYQNESVVGSNVIEKVIGGCAIIENWTDSSKHEGKSFFYYNRATERWKQIWVQDDGFWKEKEWQPSAAEDGVRFQGVIRLKSGVQYLDRTTLTQMKDGHVRQLIEISRDNGKNWISTFDAIYMKK